MTRKKLPMDWPKVVVTVFYDDGRSKAFTDEYEARRFYTRMAKEGRSPSIKAVKR